MKYHEVVERVRRVINSCETIEQLKVAGKYSVLLIVKQFKKSDGDDLSDYFANRKKEEEMVSWLKMLVRKQKLAIK